MRIRLTVPVCWLGIAILVSGCSSRGSSYNRRTEQSDLQFEIVEISGVTTDRGSSGGASWIDYDGDGDLDLFVTNGYDVSAGDPAPQPNRLYRNDGPEGFTAIAEGVLVESEAYSSGHAWADYDNDGDLDVFVANQRDQDNLLYRNEGGGRFTLIEDEPPVNDGGQSYGAGWVDVDGDGWLDLFVANGGMSHAGPNGLYRGTGDGHFAKVAEGVLVTDEAATCGFAWGDYDNDGDPDLFVANSGFNPATNSNALYRNDGDWAFTRIADTPATGDGLPSCAASWADVDNDQDLDLYVTMMYGLANLLYINDGQGGLEPVEDTPPTVDGGHSYETNWEDYDNDGDLDLAVANWGAGAKLYLNDGRGGFAGPSGGEFTNRVHYTGTMVSADFDADGDIDIYLASWPNNPGPQEQNRLYRNRMTDGHWLQVRLVGRISNRSAIGARVLVTTRVATATVTQMREITTTTGFRGQRSLAVHFGLGVAEKIESIEVRWPSGQTSQLRDVAADQLIEIVEEAESSSS